MDVKDIEQLVLDKVKLMKGSALKSVVKDEKKKYPDLNPVYAYSCELRERIEIHSELDSKPIDLMKRRGPNEDDRQYQYRKENFNNVTMPFFMKAMGKLNRIMNRSNYSVQWDANQAEQKDYFETEIPVFGSIDDYFEQIVLSSKITDPNALIVIRPDHLPTKEVDGEPGEAVADDTQYMPVMPFIVECPRVIDFLEDTFALILLEEKSLVKVGNLKKREGLIFEFYDRENIYRITQEGLKSDWKFSEPKLYYPHNLGYLPCAKLKGIPKIKDKYIIYQSYFIYAIPFLDVALYEFSNLDTATVAHMFPQKVEWVDRCDNEECDNGYVKMLIDEKMHNTLCPNCKGQGTKTRTGPLMSKQFVIPDPNTTDPVTSVQFPGMAFVSPDSAPLEFVHKKFELDVARAFSFVNIEVSNENVKGSETALGKQIDREELFSFLLRISNELFALMHFTIKAMGQMRYGEGFETPVVSAPVSFSIRSEADLTAELIEAQKANLPDAAIREIIKEIISKRFSNQKDISKVTTLVFGVDRILTKSDLVIAGKLASGIVAKWEVVLHDSIYMFIDNLMLEDEKFFDKPFPAQKEQIEKMAKDLTTEIEASQPGSTESIIDKAA